MTLEKYNFIANTVNKVKRDVRIAFITRTVILRDDTRIVPYVSQLWAIQHTIEFVPIWEDCSDCAQVNATHSKSTVVLCELQYSYTTSNASKSSRSCSKLS